MKEAVQRRNHNHTYITDERTACLIFVRSRPHTGSKCVTLLDAYQQLHLRYTPHGTQEMT